jgi:ABC-type transport system substrate-binding protein
MSLPNTPLAAGLNVINKDMGGVLIFHCNMQWASPVFSDIRFRKALNLAIDKEAIIKQLFAGLAKPIAMYPGSNIFALGGDPTLKPYPFDPQEARRLIKEGGWEGHEFTLISYDRAGCPEITRVIEAMAGFWEKIGVRPKIRISDYGAWQRAWADRKTQNTIHGYDATSDPEAGSLLEKMSQKWDFANKSGRSTINIPEVNAKFEKADRSKDIAEISKLLAEIYLAMRMINT